MKYLTLFVIFRIVYSQLLSSGVRATCQVVFPTDGLRLVLHSPLMKAKGSRFSLLEPFYV